MDERQKETGREPDWGRIRHLLKLGIFAALMVLAGDMLLGYGVPDPTVKEIPAMYSRYLSVPDGRIVASALLGLVGIPLECLCWFAVYRMIAPYSAKEAHAYRAGIIGCLAFGGCGVHVPCCILVYLMKRFYAQDASTVAGEILRFAGWFLLPAMVLFLIFFLITIVTQARAFLAGHTPLPRSCWTFSLLFGVVWAIVMKLFGNDHALANALATGWISAGNLWMLGGLLWATRGFEA